MAKLKTIKRFLRTNQTTSFLYRKLVRAYYLTRRQFPRTYRNWIAKSESLTTYESLETAKNHLILICLDVTSLSENEATLCIESIRNQDYPHWQLMLSSTEGNDYVQNIVALDQRIQIFENKIELLESVKLKQADNQWLMFLNGSFLLSEHCLTEFNLSINNSYKNTALIYSDHDTLNRLKKRTTPHFKPDWNPDLFISQEYIENCCMVNCMSFFQVASTQYNASRNSFYELVLKIALSKQELTISHISKILFHQVKPSEKLVQRKVESVLQSLFDMPMLKLSSNEQADYQVNWPIIPNKQPLVSLIIPTRNGYKILKQAIDSIIDKTTYENYEIIIVNNQSDCAKTINYMQTLEQNHSKVKILTYDHPFNYSSINNFAAKHAKGTVLGFVNNDIEVLTPDWLSEMVSHAIRSDIGCVGAKLYYPNDTIQHARVIVGLWGCAGHSHKFFKRNARGYCDRLLHPQNYSAVTAACMLLEKDLFVQVEGFNEEDLPVAFNDIDLCLKVEQLGLRNLWTPYAELYHHESVSRGVDIKPEQLERSQKEIEYMRSTWKTENYQDPAYNKNLTYTSEDFSITRKI